MNYEKIEEMLYDAKNQLPTTEMEWKISDAMEEKYGNKKTAFKKTGMRISRTMVATFAILFIMVVGGGTMLASIGLKYTDNFGQWTGMRSNSWIDCENELKKRNGQLPEAFEEYEFESCSTTLVAKKETSSYVEALKENVYTPLHIQYINTSDESKINISVGTTEEYYWHFYYEYKKVHKEGMPEIFDTWEPESYDTYFEYRGIKVFSSIKGETEDSLRIKWTWVDVDDKNCWTVYVPQDADINGQELVKEIITLNTSAWTDQNIYIQEQAEPFEGFSLGDYKTEDEVYPVIYNEEMYVIIYENGLDITLYDTYEKFTVEAPNHISYGLYNNHVESIMRDVNNDGVEELIFLTTESGTLNVSYVDVIDLANKCCIMVDYNVQQLADAFYEMDATYMESYEVGIWDHDEKTFMDDGTICVITSFTVLSQTQRIGKIVGTLVYDAQQNTFVLDTDSISIEWNE